MSTVSNEFMAQRIRELGEFLAFGSSIVLYFYYGVFDDLFFIAPIISTLQVIFVLGRLSSVTNLRKYQIKFPVIVIFTVFSLLSYLISFLYTSNTGTVVFSLSIIYVILILLLNSIYLEIVIENNILTLDESNSKTAPLSYPLSYSYGFALVLILVVWLAFQANIILFHGFGGYLSVSNVAFIISSTIFVLGMTAFNLVVKRIEAKQG